MPGTLIEMELPEGGAAAGSRRTLEGLKPDALTCTKCWLGSLPSSHQPFPVLMAAV